MDGTEAEYMVERVVDHKMISKCHSFQVLWLGYSSAEDSCISEVELWKSAAESVDDYLELLDV